MAMTITTSTVYWCIASKWNVPLFFLWNEQKVFVGGFITFQLVLTLAVLQWQKGLPDISGTIIQEVAPLAPMEPAVHTLSDELILQISCNIFLAFEWILMMRSGQIYNIIRQLSYRFMCLNHDLIWLQNKIDAQKHFHKNTITSS